MHPLAAYLLFLSLSCIFILTLPALLLPVVVAEKIVDYGGGRSSNGVTTNQSQKQPFCSQKQQREQNIVFVYH
jgi:hypothetical protein